MELGRIVEILSETDQQLVEWEPPEALRPVVPFRCRFQIRRTNTGLRTFVPEFGLQDLEAVISTVKTVYMAGLAIRSHVEQFSLRELDQWRTMQWLYEWARRSPEHADREFAWVSDLVGTAAAVRSGLIAEPKDGHKPHMIPPEFGSWDLPRVLAAGRDAAEHAGISTPDAKVQVQYGLVEVARTALDDVKYRKTLSEMNLRRIVLEALSAADIDDDTMTHAATHRIVKRFSRWLVKHRCQTTAEFMDLLMSPGASFLSALVRPKRGGGRIEHVHGRQLMLALGWIAYSYVAAGIATFMANFKALITPPLTDAESISFDDFYLPQPHYGDLPFLLLFERRHFLEPVIRQLWESGPSPELTLLLRACLRLYGLMLRPRREIDRQLHRKKPPQAPQNVSDDKYLSEIAQQDQPDSTSENHDWLVHHIYTLPATRFCDCPPAETVTTGFRPSPDGGCVVDLKCRLCNRSSTRVVSPQELQQLRKRARADE